MVDQNRRIPSNKKPPRIRDGFQDRNYGIDVFDKSAPGRTVDNVYDDNVWGSEWDEHRQSVAQELERREAARGNRDEAEAESAAQKKQAKEELINSNAAGPYSWPRREAGGMKYHVGADGQARRCKAEIRSCPYGEDSHFSMHEGAGVDPQDVARWLLERRDAGEPQGSLLAIDEVTPSPRDVLAKLKDRSVAESHVAVIELQAELALDHADMDPIEIERKIGNTYDNRYQDKAYWVLRNRYETVTLASETISLAKIEDFVRDHVNRYAFRGSIDPDAHLKEEAQRELVDQMLDLMRTAEGEAGRSPRSSAFHSTVPLPLETLQDVGPSDKPGLMQGSFAFEEGFDPSHIDYMGETSTTVPPTFAPGFEVYEKDTGAGLAQWKATRSTNGGWDIEVQGSFGDLTLFHTDSQEEAEALFSSTLENRVRSNSNHTETFREGELVTPEDRETKLQDRSGYLKRLITVAQEQDAKRETYFREEEERKQAAIDKIRNADYGPTIPQPQKKSGLGKLFGK